VFIYAHAETGSGPSGPRHNINATEPLLRKGNVIEKDASYGVHERAGSGASKSARELRLGIIIATVIALVVIPCVMFNLWLWNVI
jgi:hypothetical protein